MDNETYVRAVFARLKKMTKKQLVQEMMVPYDEDFGLPQDIQEWLK